MADEMAKVIEELARVKNVGPARAEQIYKELQISTLDELIKAAAAHRLQTLSGIGEKTEASILQSAQRQVSAARYVPQIESEVLTEQDFLTSTDDADPEVEILSEDEFFQDAPEELTAASAEILAIREELANIEAPAAQLPSGALRELSLVEDALDTLGRSAPATTSNPEPEPAPEPAPAPALQAQPKAVLKKALARKLRAAKQADASLDLSEAPHSTSAAAVQDASSPATLAVEQLDAGQDAEPEAATAIVPTLEAASWSPPTSDEADALYDPLVEAAENLVMRATEPSLAHDSEPEAPLVPEPHSSSTPNPSSAALPDEPVMDPTPSSEPQAPLAAAGWVWESEAQLDQDVEPAPLHEPEPAALSGALSSSEPALADVQPEPELSIVEAKADVEPALTAAEDSPSEPPQDELALEAAPQPSASIEEEAITAEPAAATQEPSLALAAPEDEAQDDLEASPHAEAVAAQAATASAPVDEAVAATAPSAISAESLFLGALICPNCGHDELKARGRALVCQACRREYDRVAGVTQLAPPTRAYDVGLAQRVMETQLYASLYEQVMRPKLTSLVTERTLTQEYLLAAEYLELSPGVRLLDVACGTGNFTRHFAEALRDLGAQAPSLLVGLDMSEPMLAKASEYLKAAELVDEVFLVRGDAARLPFRRGAFDRVHCAGALHMMEDPDEALRHFARVLQPDGILVIGTFVEGSGLLRRALKRAAQLPTHFRWFNPQELRQRLERAGFEVQAQSQAQDALTLRARRV